MSDKTLQEAMEELIKAWLDRFAKRLNLEFKPWGKEREIRERWKDDE